MERSLPYQDLASFFANANLDRPGAEHEVLQVADRTTRPRTYRFCLRCRVGKPLKIDSVASVFQWLRVEAGVLKLDDSGYHPCLYDFRHTFAVTRLVTCCRDGEDAQRLLPHLATYMGHVDIDHTAHYLTMTMELLASSAMPWGRPDMRDHSALGPWIRRFLVEHLTEERNLSKNTQHAHRDTVALLVPFASTQPKTQIDRLRVEDLTHKR